jgi:hypothetical protein
VLGNHLASAHDLLADHITCDSIPEGSSVANDLRFSCMHAKAKNISGNAWYCIMLYQKEQTVAVRCLTRESRTDAGVSAGS